MIERVRLSWSSISPGMPQYRTVWLRCRAEALLDQAWRCAPWLAPQTPANSADFADFADSADRTCGRTSFAPNSTFFGGTATAFGSERQRGWRGRSPFSVHPQNPQNPL